MIFFFFRCTPAYSIRNFPVSHRYSQTNYSHSLLVSVVIAWWQVGFARSTVTRLLRMITNQQRTVRASTTLCGRNSKYKIHTGGALLSFVSILPFAIISVGRLDNKSAQLLVCVQTKLLCADMTLRMSSWWRRVFQNRVLTHVYQPDRHEVTGDAKLLS